MDVIKEMVPVVERLKREGYVSNERVIQSLLKVPREEFLPEELREYV